MITLGQIAAVLAALVVIGAFAKQSYMWVSTRPQWFVGFSDRRAAIRRKNDMLDLIVKEFRPNGGSSHKDQMNRVEKAIGDIGHSVTRLVAEREVDFMLAVDPMWKADANGLFTDVNRAFCDLVGHDASEAEGRNWKNIVHREDVEGLARDWAEAVRDGRDFTGRWRVVSRSGRIVEIQGRAEVIRDNTGCVLGWKGRIAPVISDVNSPRLAAARG